MAMDVRFAALETVDLAQMEAAIGGIPGAGGTAHLPRLMGRARALEMMLGTRLDDVATAERYGLVNRAFTTAELDAFVEALARRIATLAPGVAAATLEVVDTALESFDAALRAEDRLLFGLFAQPKGWR